MSSPVPMFGTQNLHDDDGSVIDSFLIETDTPPDVKDAIEPIEQLPAKVDVPTYTRIMSGIVLFLGGETSPVNLVPFDDNRIRFHLDVTSAATTPAFADFILVADEPGKLSNPAATSTQPGFRVHNGKGVDMDEHTGPVWVIPGAGITNAIEISWRAVTL
jgi:hypothetical protein